MVAERENNGVQSPNIMGSALKNVVGGGSISGVPTKMLNHRRSQGPGGHYSSQGMMSDDVDDFNLNDIQNDKMNEEIKRLLEENRRALN